MREDFFGIDVLKTEIDVPLDAKSVIVRFGDKEGKYVINGTVHYSKDGEKWRLLKAYANLPRRSPYICLSVYPPVHKKLRFNIEVKGGKFRDIYASPSNCQQEGEKIRREEEERKKEGKGFFEQLTDLVKAYTMLLVVLLIIGIVAFVVFLLFKYKVL